MKKKPYKFDDIKRKNWLLQYQNSGSFTNACKAVKITRQIVYYTISNDPKFKQDKEDIDNLIDDAVESRLFALTKKSPVACFFWLCNRRKDQWKNIQKLEHTGNIDDPLRIIYVPADKSKDDRDIPKEQGK